jgi:hypothetical protein
MVQKNELDPRGYSQRVRRDTGAVSFAFRHRGRPYRYEVDIVAFTGVIRVLVKTVVDHA